MRQERTIRLVLTVIGLMVLGGLLIPVLSTLPGGANDEWVDPHRHLLSTLALACKFYAGEHGGAMPPDLRALFPKYIDGSYLAHAMVEVEYFPGATDASNPATVTMRERQPDRRGRRWIEHVDCSVELVQPSATP